MPHSSLFEMIILTSLGWKGQWHGYMKRGGIVRTSLFSSSVYTYKREIATGREREREKRFNWVASRHVFYARS